jgi:dipeptidyl aminopeptidase/acylaminoacyl peptidase
VLDVATRRARQLTSGDYDDGQHDWSPDSRHLVFVSNRVRDADIANRNSDLFVVPAGGGEVRQLTHGLGPKLSPTWSPDGGSIAFLAHRSWPDTIENLHVWTVPARRGPAQDAMPGADLMCDALLLSDVRDNVDAPAPRPEWSPDSRRIWFVATQQGATNIWEIDVSGGAPRQRTFGAHEIPGLSVSRDGRRWALVRHTATSPAEVYVAEASSAPRRSATTAGDPSLPGARLRTVASPSASPRARPRQPEELRIPCAGGYEIQGWVLRASTPRARGPAILMLHGGPYAAFGSTYSHEFQMLASHGYHVIYANLRGSVGYGREFMRALVGKWGTVDHDDVTRIAQAAQELPFVDAARIAIAGGSYGGYLAAWMIAHTRRFKCAIAMRGVYDLISMHGTSDIGWELVTEFEAQRPWESLDRWWRVSPLAHVTSIRTPLLLLHAEEDHRVPVSQAEELFAALRLLGRDVELVRFLGESHGLSRSGRPHNRVERLRRVLDWLERKL